MKNKQNITNSAWMINFITLAYIPLGMYRSVEKDDTSQKLHPIRDASLTGCKGRESWTFSTERCIPTEYNLCKIKPGWVIYFSFLFLL